MKKTIHPSEYDWLFQSRRLPARLEADEAAQLLGLASHTIPVLVGKGMLKPLGRPSQKASKKFALADIEVLTKDRNWLDRATRVLEEHWANANSRKGKAVSPA